MSTMNNNNGIGTMGKTKSKFSQSNRGFFMMEGLFLACYCSIYGFTISILLEYGYTPAQCGVVTMLQNLAYMLVQPIYGYLIDTRISAKKLLIINNLISAVMVLFLPFVFTQNSGIVFLYLTVMAFFAFSNVPVADTWIVTIINKTKTMDYGIVRSGGSISYATTALVAGSLIAPFGVEILFYIHAVFCVLTVVVAIFLVDDKKVESVETDNPHQCLLEKKSFASGMKVLFTDKTYMVLVATMCLFQFSARLSNNYLPMVISAVGGDNAHFGLAVFIGASGEVLVMIMASRLLARGMPPSYLFMASLATLALRYSLMGVIDNLWVMIGTQTLLAVGVGLNLRVIVEYLYKIAPKGYEATAILVLGSISNGVGSVLGSYIGGQIIQYMGIRVYIFICAGAMVLATIIFIPTVVQVYRHQQTSQQSLSNS